MSDHEISLRMLTKNEQMSESLVFLSESLNWDLLIKPMSEFTALALYDM